MNKKYDLFEVHFNIFIQHCLSICVMLNKQKQTETNNNQSIVCFFPKKNQRFVYKMDNKVVNELEQFVGVRF